MNLDEFDHMTRVILSLSQIRIEAVTDNRCVNNSLFIHPWTQGKIPSHSGIYSGAEAMNFMLLL